MNPTRTLLWFYRRWDTSLRYPHIGSRHDRIHLLSEFTTVAMVGALKRHVANLHSVLPPSMLSHRPSLSLFFIHASTVTVAVSALCCLPSDLGGGHSAIAHLTFSYHAGSDILLRGFPAGSSLSHYIISHFDAVCQALLFCLSGEHPRRSVSSHYIISHFDDAVNLFLSS